MSDTGKQSPLGVNVTGSVLQNTGLCINPVNQGYIGASKYNDNYDPGSLVNNTCLKWLTYAINDAYTRGYASGANNTVSTATYNNLISIGNGNIPALGNSPPDTYTITDPSNQWTGQATTGYYVTGDTGDGQEATWLPYDTTNPNKSVTQWGYIRLFALQAWNEFNYNGKVYGDTGFSSMPEYKDFTSTFLTADNFVSYTNTSINAAKNSQTFLENTYSNMNDLISADITGVSLATHTFGQDCVAAGKAIDLSKISKYGLPSVLLQTIKKYNALTQSLSLALLSTGLEVNDIDQISRNNISASKLQEQQIYGAFLIIMGQDLLDVLVPLNCKTAGLDNLADLLNIQKLFPNSYQSITVPIYNTNPSPTNSKTYYPIFEGNSLNARLESPEIKNTVGTTIPVGEPPIITPPMPTPATVVADTKDSSIENINISNGTMFKGIMSERSV